MDFDDLFDNDKRKQHGSHHDHDDYDIHDSRYGRRVQNGEYRNERYHHNDDDFDFSALLRNKKLLAVGAIGAALLLVVVIGFVLFAGPALIKAGSKMDKDIAIEKAVPIIKSLTGGEKD